MQITFEELWDRRGLAKARAALPIIEDATVQDQQIRVPRPAGKLRPDGETQATSLDRLAELPGIRSVFAEWPCTLSVDLPQVTSFFIIHDDTVEPAFVSHLPNVRQLVASKVAPESLANLRQLVDTSFDWRRYEIPAGYPAMDLLRNPKLVESFPRATSGAPALAELRGLERLQIRDFHYRDRSDPIAELRSVRWLSLQGWRNLRALGTLAELERLELWEVDMANLRAFRKATNIRRLGLAGRLDSIAGIEAMQSLKVAHFGGRAIRDLALLAELPALEELTLNYPDAVHDFGPIAKLSKLRRLEILLGDNTDAGELATIDFLGGLEHLEELVLLNVDIVDRRLDALHELPRLRRLKLTGKAGPDVELLRARRPDVELETHLVGEPAGRVYVGAVHYDPPRPGIAQWSIFQSLADILIVSTNSQAESRVRSALQLRDPALLRRLEFDTESGAVGIYARSEAEIRSVANLVVEIADARKKAD